MSIILFLHALSSAHTVTAARRRAQRSRAVRPRIGRTRRLDRRRRQRPPHGAGTGSPSQSRRMHARALVTGVGCVGRRVGASIVITAASAANVCDRRHGGDGIRRGGGR